MARRPSPRSDAQIRDQYRRGLRRSEQAQAIAQDLEDGDGIDPIALGRWNRGQAQRPITRANAAVAARGFSAAEADRGRAMQLVNEALQARPDSSLPPAGKAMFERMQSRLPGNAEEFLRDADEYSGRRARDYNIGRAANSRNNEAEKALQRQGLSAEDYWERNPESKRTATVRTNATRTETVSSDPNGPTVTTSRPAVREVDLMDLRDQADRRAEDENRQARENKTAPDMARFYATEKDRKQQRITDRKEAEETSAKRFGKFLADQDIEKRKLAEADAFLEATRQKARASRAAAAEATLDGRVLDKEFWDDNADYQVTMRKLGRMDRDQQRKWALEQLADQEEQRQEQLDIARQRTSQQDPFITSFLDGKEPISLSLNRYFATLGSPR